MPTRYRIGCRSGKRALFIAYSLIFLFILLVILPSGKVLSAAEAGRPYADFKSSYGTIHWLKEQMPLRVYVSQGQTLDAILDPQLGAPKANVDNMGVWPDVAAEVLSSGQIQALPVAKGYVNQHRDAVFSGINQWKAFEPEGIFKFQIVDNPNDADIYVFFCEHFVNKLGLALFANDIRGYTAKRSFPYSAIAAGRQCDFKPVVIVLRTTDTSGDSMPLGKMVAAAAHEFGHALGIEGHSANRADLMSVYYGNGRISANDAATIRYLYRLTPDLVP